MNENETALARAFDRAYINGKFVTLHGTQIVDLVNPTNNTVIGKVTMADEIDTRQAIAAAKEAFNAFSQSGKEYRMDCLQRLHDAVAKRMDQLVDATVLEYGAPQDRAKGSNNLAANIFLHFKEVLKDFDLARTVGTSKVVMEPAGVVGIFTPWNSSAGSIAIKVAPAIAAGCTVVIKPSEMSAMQTEVLMDAFHEAGLPPGVINFVTGLGEVVGTELTKSPDIQKIAFTGSTQIGKLVAKNSLDTMKALDAGTRRQVAEHHSGRRRFLHCHSDGCRSLLPEQRSSLHRGFAPDRAGRPAGRSKAIGESGRRKNQHGRSAK
jgi:aldehyde dehydrogenase (NAD+)